MANASFIIEIHSDTATISATPAVSTTLPASNMQKLGRAAVCRTTSVANQAFTLNFPDYKLINSFALTRHNLSPLGTIRLRIYQLPNLAGTLLYEKTIQATPSRGWGEFVWGDLWLSSIFEVGQPSFTFHFMGAGFLAQSAEIFIVDTAPITTYFEFNRLYLGRAITTQYNFSYGWQWGIFETVEQRRTESGVLISDKQGQSFRKVSINFEHLSESDRALFSRWMRLSGVSKDFFVALLPDETGLKGVDLAFPAKLMQPLNISNNFLGNYQSQLSFEET